jgi:hypothetical protein
MEFTPVPIPIDDIFKIHVYDAKGNVTKVYIFSGNYKDESNIHELFTNEILDIYETNKTEFIFSPHFIYRDDSIQTIKRKLLHHLSGTNTSYDDLYLFSWKQMPTPFHIHDYGDDHETVLKNTDLDPSTVIQPDTTVHMMIPLGYTNAQSTHIVKNPYLIQNLPMPNTTIADNDTTLLLKYGSLSENDLFCIFAQNVLENKEEQESNILKSIFYPYLTFHGETTELTKTPMEPKISVLDDCYEIYHKNSNKLPYTKDGIQSFTFAYNVQESKRKWPLEALFKQLHATKTRPFLMYNPGKFRENIIRLFTNKRAQNGKLIPLLTKKELQKIQFTIGNPPETLHAYLTNGQQEMFIVMYRFGEMKIHCTCSKEESLSFQEWNDVVSHLFNEFVLDINKCMYHIGYRMKTLVNLNDISVSSLKTVSTIVIQDGIRIWKSIPCMTEVLDIYNDNVSNKHDIYLRYKRSDRYLAKEAKRNLVKFVLDHYDDDNATNIAKQRLMQNYSMNDKEATSMLDNFENGNINESEAGFPIIFSLHDNLLTVTCNELTSFQYIPLLKLLVDCILRFTQTKWKSTVSNTTLCETMTTVMDTPFQEVPTLELDAASEAGEQMEEPFDMDMDEFNEENFQFDEDMEIPPSEPKTVVPATTPAPMATAAATAIANEDDEEEDNDENRLEGMPLNKYFLKRLQKRDPALFVYKKDGYESYSRMCPASDYRQPIILTEEEYKDIEQNHKDAYTYALPHGSSADNNHYYVCPRYWCLKTQKPLTEEEVNSGICGSIIPSNAKTVPNGAYVYEFNSGKKQHKNLDGTYANNNPGFLKETNPLGLKLPCCFKKVQAEKKQDASAKEKDEYNDVKYVISHSTFPIPRERWGFLPLSVQSFLKTDNNAARNKKKPSHVAPNKPCLLRYGVEFSETQSFLACFAEFYTKVHHPETYHSNPSIQEMQQILAAAITIDDFVSYQRGNLVQVFSPTTIQHDDAKIDIQKYENFTCIKNIPDIAKKQSLIAAYEIFIGYLTDPDTTIDHTYLWDIFTVPNKNLMKNGANLVVLEIQDNDDTDNVSLICPTNSNVEYDPKKETFILLKKGAFYEPIYQYLETKNELHITKGFRESFHTGNIQKVLKLVRQSSKHYCAPKQSRNKIYTFQPNASAEKAILALKQAKLTVQFQVINYNYQCIGLYVKEASKLLEGVIPCAPSAVQPNLPWKYMDDSSLWQSFVKTTELLKLVHSKTDLPCLPRVAIAEDEVVIGILTDTNQFLKITPIFETELQTELDIVHHADYIVSDKTLMTSEVEDVERVESVKKVKLETQFFTAFRTVVRSSLHKSENKEWKDQIVDILDHETMSYEEKMKAMIGLIYHVLGSHAVSFQPMEVKDVLKFGEITGCSVSYTNHPFCLMKQEGGQEHSVLLIPSINLVNGMENQRLYVARMADELIRNHRIRRFMMDPKLYFSDMNVRYEVYSSELLILISALETYFDNIDVFDSTAYFHNLTRDIAQPLDTNTKYLNVVGVQEQEYMMTHEDTMPGADGVAAASASAAESGDVEEEDTGETEETEETSDDDTGDSEINVSDTEVEKEEDIVPVVGVAEAIQGNRSTGKWVFPLGGLELKFPENTNFAAIQYVLYKTQQSSTVEFIKQTICNSKYITDPNYSSKTVKIFKDQKKTKLMTDLISRRKSFQEIIEGDTYYLTDLDLWILATELQLPILLFSATPLKNMVEGFWLFLSSNKEQIHGQLFFMRSNTTRNANTPPEYSVITPNYTYRELVKDGAKMIKDAVEQDKLITLDKFYDTVTSEVFQIIQRR